MPSLAAPDLNDPATCGEDLAFNLANVSALAERHCRGCGDYHVVFAARRLTGSAESVEIDRAEMARLIASVIEDRLALSPSASVLIAGAADTGILATAAHAVAGLGTEALYRTSFLVLDRCPTPLRLCAAYAERNRLRVATEAVDLSVDETPRAVDIVVVHSLFRHMPLATHVETLHRFASWLRPGGQIVFSHRIVGEDAATVTSGAEREETAIRIRRRVESGELVIGEPLAAFEARIARRRLATVHTSSYASVDSLMGLFAAAGLKAVSVHKLHRAASAPGAHERTRLIAMLTKP